MKKKDKQNMQQLQASQPKRGIRLSTIIDVFMFITGILLTVMFFLPVYKDTVTYNKDFFKLDNLIGFFPDNAASYMGLAGRFLDDRNIAVTIMIIAFMLVMPILLAVLTFPKLRKISALSVLPIIVLVAGQFFFGSGFVVEQKALEFAPFGYFYNVLIFQLPVLYILFIIQSIIEAGRMKKEAKNAPVNNTPVNNIPVNNIPDPMYQQQMNNQPFGMPQGGYNQPMGQQYAPQGGFEQPVPPVNDQSFGMPQGGFNQPMGQQYAPQGGFEQPVSPVNDQQFEAPLDDVQQAQERVEETFSSVEEHVDNIVAAPETVAEDVAETVSENVSEATSEVQEEVVEMAAPSSETEQPVRMQPAFCQQCGARLEQGALFCMQCGAPVK